MKAFANYESWALSFGKPGDVFYTDKKLKTMTASAHYYKRKIQTECVTMVGGLRENPNVACVTKVTILE
jgi:hypothetical protein